MKERGKLSLLFGGLECDGEWRGPSLCIKGSGCEEREEMLEWCV